MSNRFAWAWKLTNLGLPVVLVYLGFLGAIEMSDEGKPFSNHADWDCLVKSYSERIVPPRAWNSELSLNGEILIPLIRSYKGQCPARS
jgi:hypothetical protein